MFHIMLYMEDITSVKKGDIFKNDKIYYVANNNYKDIGVLIYYNFSYYTDGLSDDNYQGQHQLSFDLINDYEYIGNNVNLIKNPNQ